jgi:hypothetical protein
MSSNKVKLQVFITPQYEVSSFLKKATPEETEYILDYGENLLREHQSMANKGILDERLEGLTKTLNDKTLETQTLHSKLKSAQQSAKQEAQSIKIQHSKQVESLKQEVQMLKKQTADDFNSKLKDQLTQQSEQYDIKMKQIIKDNEKEIQALRNKYMNDAKLDTQRLSVQLDEQLKQNKILQNKLEQEREQIYKLNDKIRKEIMEEIHARNKMEKEIVKNEIKDSYVSIISNLEKRIKEMKMEMESKEKCLFDVGKIVKYYEFENTAVKGAKGENKVQEIIKSYYKNASITDTSGTPHMGDLRLIIKDLNCLIEIKNKKYVSEDDVKKFLSDIESNKKTINCALFVSLESENIPTKGNFHVEIVNTMPIIYIYKYDNSSINFAIECLMFLIDKFSKLSKKSRKTEEISTNMIDIITSVNKTNRKEINRINTIIKHLERQVAQLQISKKNLTSENINIQTLFNNSEIELAEDSPDEKEEEETVEESYTNDEIDKVKKWTLDNKKVPVKSDIQTILNITRYEVDKRGTKSIRKKMKDYLSTLPSY